MKSTTQSERRRPRPRNPNPPVADAWSTLSHGELRILQVPPLERIPWLVHGFSTRPGGASSLAGRAVLSLGFTDWDTREHVDANRAAFLAALGASRMKLVTLRQVHSAMIHAVGEVPERAPRGDALITQAPALLLAAQTADCLPILLADTKRRAIAAVHAGWRGTLARIAAKTLGRMQMAFQTRPADLVAAIGPGIGRCCYEVGPDVAQAYASQFARAADWFDGPFSQLTTGEEPNPLPWLSKAPPGHEPPPVRVRLDLVAANRWQLEDAGVPAANITASGLCTACRTDLLFSYRREARRTGRLIAVIGLRR